MRRREFLIGTAASAVALQLPLKSAFAQETTVRWASSAVGAGSQTVISSIIGVVSPLMPEAQISEQVTSGPVENVRLLKAGEIEIAHTTTGDAYNSYFGTKMFESEGPSEKMRGLFGMYPSNTTLVVARDSPIQTIADLKGKRIAIGGAGTGAALMMEEWLKAYGIASEAELQRVDYGQGADFLRTGAVDAALVYGSGDDPASFVQELMLSMEVRPLGWDVSGPEYAKLQEDAPEVAIHGTFSKDMIPGTESDVTVPTVYSSEYGTSDLPDDVVYRMMTLVWEKRQDIVGRTALASWMAASAGNMLEGLLKEIPVHPGAARFYKEQGIWSDEFTEG